MCKDKDNILKFKLREEEEDLVYTLTCSCGGQDYAIISRNPFSETSEHTKVCLLCDKESLIID